MASRAGTQKVWGVIKYEAGKEGRGHINHIMVFGLYPNSNGKHLKGFIRDRIFILQKSLWKKGGTKGF